MSSILLTGPAAEPLSLEKAKTFLRVEHSDDDEVIRRLPPSVSCAVHCQSSAPADGRLSAACSRSPS